MDMTGIRQRPNGSWEVSYKDGSGVRRQPTFRNLDEAVSFRNQKKAEAATGKMHISKLVEMYTSGSEARAPSTVELARQFSDNFTPLEAIDYEWVIKFVNGLKAKRLAPGTIRKKVETLSNMVDWYHKAILREPSKYNPFSSLDRGYSVYANTKDAPVDQKRDRRLFDGEYERCIAAVNGDWKGSNRQKYRCDNPDAFIMLFCLLVDTGMRLREAFTLRHCDIVIDGPLSKIKLRRPSKRKQGGKEREIPIKPQLLPRIAKYVKDYPGAPAEPIFPYWSGIELDTVEETNELLKDIGNRLSHRFASLFSYIGAPDLTAHDLRHEGICRWLELKDASGNWAFRQEEVMRISGHDTTASFDRYVTFRGQNLGARLYA